MSKNVLIVSSNPRKGGNSDTLCDQFMKGGYIEGLLGAKEMGPSMELGLGSLAIFKATLLCRKPTRWGKASVDIDYYKK